jgi:CDGSH-type Zn-finger protein
MAVKVTVFNNGPIKIEGTPGEFEIHDAQGSVYGLGGRAAISLCRCGLSSNKPFCDGTHGRQGFESMCEARELPPPKPKV